MSHTPQVCPCRFCESKFSAAGITNHETYCDANPHQGVPVEKQEELGLLDDSEDEDETETSPTADPDQRDAETRLPARESVADADKPTGDSVETSPRSTSKCPICGSTDILPSHEARENYADHLGEVPEGLRATFDATESYCCRCYAVWGGALDEAHRIADGGSA